MRRISMAAPARTFTTSAIGRDVTGGRPVPAGMLRYGQFIDGRRIITAPTPAMVNGKRAVRVRLDGESKPRTYFVTELVVVKARLEIAAGPVAEGWAVSAPGKVRVDPMRGKWRGETGRGNSRRIDMIAGMTAYDG